MIYGSSFCLAAEGQCCKIFWIQVLIIFQKNINVRYRKAKKQQYNSFTSNPTYLNIFVILYCDSAFIWSEYECHNIQ